MAWRFLSRIGLYQRGSFGGERWPSDTVRSLTDRSALQLEAELKLAFLWVVPWLDGAHERAGAPMLETACAVEERAKTSGELLLSLRIESVHDANFYSVHLNSVQSFSLESGFSRDQVVGGRVLGRVDAWTWSTTGRGRWLLSDRCRSGVRQPARRPPGNSSQWGPCP